MSIEKNPHRDTIGGRLQAFRKSKRLNSVQFAKEIGISQGSLSDLENDKTRPSCDTLASLHRNTDINVGWLLTGEGDFYTGKGGKDADEDPEVARLLSMTRDVLKSKTGYAFSLSANIQSFHEAVEDKQLVHELKAEVRTLTTRVAQLEEDRAAAREGARARDGDPPGQAEEFIKKRAM